VYSLPQIYLRDRPSRIADRLERVAPEQLPSAAVLDGLRRSAALEAIWSGPEISGTEIIAVGGRRLFRAWMPFESTPDCVSPGRNWI
jgi:hypothetical protein